MPPKTAQRPQPDMTPDSLPGRDDRAPSEEADIAEAEDATLQEHPEGSAPPLDRLTQDRKPETEG